MQYVSMCNVERTVFLVYHVQQLSGLLPVTWCFLFCQLILILLPTLVLFNKSKWQTLHQVRKLNTLPAIKVASSFIVIFPSLVQQTNIARQTADTDTVPNMPRQSKYQAATKRSSDTRRPGRAERSVTVTSLKYFQMRNPVRCTNTNPGVWNKHSKQYPQKSINISIITDNVMLWPWLIQQDLYSRAFLWKLSEWASVVHK